MRGHSVEELVPFQHLQLSLGISAHHSLHYHVVVVPIQVSQEGLRDHLDAGIPRIRLRSEREFAKLTAFMHPCDLFIEVDD